MGAILKGIGSMTKACSPNATCNSSGSSTG
jgi:hypothetical protein